jgi:hypothetical protein
MEIAAVILGVILGFGLGEFSAYRREKQVQKKLIRSVRTMVSLEIEENLRLLWQFWESVRDLPDDVDGDALVYSQMLIRAPLPGWSHTAWESQMPSLAVALAAREIRHVHIHHNRLERLTAIRAQLKACHAEQRAEWTSARDESGMVQSIAGISRVFDWNAPELWPKCESTVKELQETGNPLPEEARQIHT